MSLVVVVKGAEGIVLAADSRVTLNTQQPGGGLLNVNFDNATKFLTFSHSNHKWVAAVTHGDAVIGSRTPHSLISELEPRLGNRRLKVSEYAEEMRKFFYECWLAQYGSGGQASGMWFVVGGYDRNEPYSAVYEFNVPNSSDVTPHYLGNIFGLRWGGQSEIATRIILGHDPALIQILKDKTNLEASQINEIEKVLGSLQYNIPYSVLPLQDCIDLATFLIRATMTVQGLAGVLRGVGGMIEVASITREGGLFWVQKKKLHGESHFAAVPDSAR